MPGRGQDLLALIEGAVVAEDHGDDRHAGLRFGDERQVGLRLVRQGRTQVAVEAGDVRGLVQGVHDQAAQNLPDRVQPVLEGRHHTEVAAPSPQRPEQAGFPVRADHVELGIAVWLLARRLSGRECGCFGAIAPATIGPRLAVRNAALAIVAAGGWYLARRENLPGLSLGQVLVTVLAGAIALMIFQYRLVASGRGTARFIYARGGRMSGIWRVVVVLLAAGLLIEAVFLVALMRQVGNLLLQGGAARVNVPAGPKAGAMAEIPGRDRTGHPALVVFTSSECEQCRVLLPGLRRIHEFYGPGATAGHQLDLMAVLTDRNVGSRAEHARELGGFARTDLVAPMQDWDVPGTPFAVALDSGMRVRGAEVVTRGRILRCSRCRSSGSRMSSPASQSAPRTRSSSPSSR